MTDQLEYVFHDVRYRLDYMMLQAKQKYYRIKDPRVITGRIKNAPLLSLRTIPLNQRYQQPHNDTPLLLLKKTGEPKSTPVDVLLTSNCADDERNVKECDVGAEGNAKVNNSDMISLDEPWNHKVFPETPDISPRKRSRLLDMLRGISSPSSQPQLCFDNAPVEMSLSPLKFTQMHKIRLAPPQEGLVQIDGLCEPAVVCNAVKSPINTKTDENASNLDVFAANLKDGWAKYGKASECTPSIRRRLNLLPPSFEESPLAPLMFPVEVSSCTNEILVAPLTTPYFDVGLLSIYADSSEDESELGA